MKEGASTIRGSESVITFDCEDDRLIGVLHRPAESVARLLDPAVLMVVGGGQYRVGAHRLYVALARELAAAGVTVLRFDVRGMGDSEGEARHYLDLEPDIQAAVGALHDATSPKAGIVLWGLCDGATAAMLAEPACRHVAAVMMVNPWITSETGRARTLLRHHYGRRLIDQAFWHSLLRGDVAIGVALRSLFATILASGLGREPGRKTPDEVCTHVLGTLAGRASGAFDSKEASETLEAGGKLDDIDEREAPDTLIVLSENDLTAREFEDAYDAFFGFTDREWIADLRHVRADHTFSDPDARDELLALTLELVDAHSIANIDDLGDF